jgi:hypothetical protein
MTGPEAQKVRNLAYRPNLVIQLGARNLEQGHRALSGLVALHAFRAARRPIVCAHRDERAGRRAWPQSCACAERKRFGGPQHRCRARRQYASIRMATRCGWLGHRRRPSRHDEGAAPAVNGDDARGRRCPADGCCARRRTVVPPAPPALRRPFVCGSTPAPRRPRWCRGRGAGSLVSGAERTRQVSRRVGVLDVARRDPPPYLEDHIGDQPTGAGLLHRRRHTPWIAAGLLAAACFVAGILAAGLIGPWPPAPAGEPRFLLLLYASAPGAAPSVDRDASARAHIAWLSGLRQQGRTITGERLADARQLIGFTGSEPPNPPVEGFFVVASDSIDDAVRIARSSPHVGEGGRIVVQAIDTP